MEGPTLKFGASHSYNPTPLQPQCSLIHTNPKICIYTKFTQMFNNSYEDKEYLLFGLFVFFFKNCFLYCDIQTVV